MGMAASQARYLGLTARKTNVEYEGQQINQARTALGNQSANLWNQMLGLTIPTVPSITNYTTLQYSFNDGINTYVVSDIQSVDKKDADGTEYNKLVTTSMKMYIKVLKQQILIRKYKKQQLQQQKLKQKQVLLLTLLKMTNSNGMLLIINSKFGTLTIMLT